MRQKLAVIGACAFIVGCAESPTTPAEPFAPQFATNAKTTISGTILHPCTGEAIAYEGTAHQSVTTKTKGDITTLRVMAHTSNVQGVGVTTGDKYVLVESIKQVQEASATPPFPYVLDVAVKDRWQSQGGADNFFGTSIYTVTFDGVTATMEFNKMITECKG